MKGLPWRLSCGCWTDTAPRKTVVGLMCPVCGAVIEGVTLEGGEDIPPRTKSAVYVAKVPVGRGYVVRASRRGARGYEVSEDYVYYARPEDAGLRWRSGDVRGALKVVCWRILPEPRAHWVRVDRPGQFATVDTEDGK